MKMLSFARAAGVAFALVLVGAIAGFTANSPYWQNNMPMNEGAWLGDQNFNIFSLWRAHVRLAGVAYTSLTTIDQSAGQANCTQLNADGVIELKTSASTGYICLPTAVAGKLVFIGNATGQTIDLYGSATTYVTGTQDYINGTIGSTAYTSMSTGKNTICFAASNGFWYCITV